MPLRLSDLDAPIRLEVLEDRAPQRLSDIPSAPKALARVASASALSPLARLTTPLLLGVPQAIQKNVALSERLANQLLPETPFPSQINDATPIPRINVPLETAKGIGREAIRFGVQAFRPDVVALGLLASPAMRFAGRLPLPGGRTVASVLRAPLGRGFVQRTAVNPPSVSPKDFFDLPTLKVKEELVDRFAPIEHFVDVVKSETGQLVAPDADPYIAARLYAGIPGRINVRVRQLGQALRPIRGQERELSLVLASRRSLERAGRGFANPTEVRVGGRLESIANPSQVLDDLERSVGPERFKVLSQAADNFTEFFNRVTLPDLEDAGIITKAQTQRILSKNPRFAPFDVLHYLDDQADKIAFPGRSFSVASQDVVKALQGTTKAIDDPIEAGVRRLFRVTALAERNRVAQKVVNLRTLGPRAQEFIKPLNSGENAPKGFDELSVFFNGTIKRFALPAPLAESLKGLTTETLDMITQFASLGSRALRAGATTFSPGFALTNPIRDFQMAKLVARQMGVKFNVRVWAKGFFEAVRRGDLFDEFERNLGAFGGYFGRLQTPGEPLSALRRAMRGRGEIAAKTIANPLELIRTVGGTLELAPRLGIFQQAMRQGFSESQAAFTSRNATIDFARMGTKMRILNLWVPFLNARLQGTINSFKAVGKNPLGSAYVISTMITAPQVATYLWNTRRYPHVWDDLRQFEKDTNFLFIYGDDKDDKGRYTQIAKIPKGDVGRVFGNPIENSLTFLDGRDAKTLDQLFLQIASDVSPASFESEGRVSPLRLLGDVTPPPLKALGLGSGALERNPFSLIPVVPRSLQDLSPHLQARPETSQSLRRLAASDLGKTLQLSPMRLEQAISAGFGSGGRLLMELLDQLQGQAVPGTPLHNAIGRRFWGALGGAEEEKDFDRVAELSQQARDTIFLKRQEVLRLIDNARRGDQKATRSLAAQFQDEEFRRLTDDYLKDQSSNLTDFDRFLKYAPVKARAQFLAEKLQRLEREDQVTYLASLRGKAILTESVAEELITLLGQQTTLPSSPQQPSVQRGQRLRDLPVEPALRPTQ